MDIRGYLIEVTMTFDTLTVTGTNAVGQFALRGPEHDEGPLVIALDDITGIDFRDANPLINGCITIRSRDGKSHELHFRRKSRVEFRELAQALTPA